MYEYIQGKLAELTPTYAVIEAAGVGYFVHISLQSYSQLANETEPRLFIHQQIREDAHVLYGFVNKEERELFRLLISVSGVGASTARIMLSSLSGGELADAIASGNIAIIKGVKGIGQKTAERLIVDLKDKVLKANVGGEKTGLPLTNSNGKEAIAALIALGFAKPATEKAVEFVLKENSSASVEELIRKTLQRL